MSLKIARILDQPEQTVKEFLNRLEKKNGEPSHDVRFLSENIQSARLKLAQLGLDPDDTTGAELHHALMGKFEKTATLFELQCGVDESDFDRRSTVATDLINQNFELPKRWFLKNSVAKNVMRQLPPKRTMKHLGYRSAESMLKRENLAEIYLAAGLIESDSWQKDHVRIVSRLDQTDFELRCLKVCSPSYVRWSSVDNPSRFVAEDQNLGVISIWPSDDLRKIPLLSMCLLLSEAAAVYGSVEPVHKSAKLSGVLDWWADMDHLVVELGGEPVSLSLNDTCLNSLMENSYEQRQLKHGRTAFWRQLLSRYEHLPPHEALFDDSLRRELAMIKFKAPQPAYEIAQEEFDG